MNYDYKEIRFLTFHDSYMMWENTLKKQSNINCYYIQMNLVFWISGFVPSLSIYLGARRVAENGDDASF